MRRPRRTTEVILASAPSALEPARSWPAQAVKETTARKPARPRRPRRSPGGVLSTRDRVAVVVGYQVRYANAAQSLQRLVVRDAQGAHRVVLGLSSFLSCWLVPVRRPGEHAGQGLLARVPTCR